MKSKFVTALCLFMNLFASCQQYGDAEKVLKNLSELYNKNEYNGLYAMLSPDFKAQAPEGDIISFYRANLKEPLGNIVSWQPGLQKDGATIFVVQFERGVLDFTMYLNDKNEIAGMQWLPSKKKTNVKKIAAAEIKTNNPKQTALQLLIDSLAIEHLQNPVNSSLSIGIINGDNREEYFYGTVTKGKEQLPGSNTLYEVGSVTKTFTGIVLAHAINEGKISAEDDIRKYLPDSYKNLEYKGSPIRIKHLSNHTSRLPRVPENLDKQPGFSEQDPYKNYGKEMVFDFLKTIKLDTTPGVVNDYSNLGVAVLGLILEDLYKQPLDVLVSRYVTTPTKMTHTTFAVADGDKTNMATGYYETDGSVAMGWSLGAFKAAGGIKSDMSDMLNYLAANMNEANADIALSHQPTFKDANMSVGLNWMLSVTREKQLLVWHNGGTAGFSSFCGYLKDKKVGVVVLNNSGVNVDKLAIGILKGMK